jgi:uncharacterized protein
VLRLSEDLPLAIEIIDLPERIEPLIAALDEMIKEGLVVLVHDVDIIKYQGRMADGIRPSPQSPD